MRVLQGVLGLQKEAVVCINACIGSGCNTSLRHGAHLRKLNTSSDSPVLPCFTLVTQKQQQLSCNSPRGQSTRSVCTHVVNACVHVWQYVSHIPLCVYVMYIGEVSDKLGLMASG